MSRNATHSLPIFLRGKDGTVSAPLVVIFGLIIFFTVLPSLLLVAMKGQSSVRRKVKRIRKGWERYRSGALRQSLRDGLRIEFTRQPSVAELIASADPELVRCRREARALNPIGPNSLVTERDVRARYTSDAVEDDELGDKIVLLLKLSLGLFACGHCNTSWRSNPNVRGHTIEQHTPAIDGAPSPCIAGSIDVETFMMAAAHKLHVPTLYISVGHRLLHASFGNHAPHLLQCGRDLVFSGLADLTTLSTAVANGDVSDAATALYVCDQLLERPLP